MNRTDAQRRADRIRAFQAELAELESAGVVSLDAEARQRLAGHHRELLADLARRFDVDTTDALRQMSWGMRIASLVAALALSAALVFYFYQLWGALGTWEQVGLLAGAPILGLAAVEYAARKDPSLYLAAILGVMTFAAFVLDLRMLGVIFGITPSQHAFLVWSGFGLLLAYAYGVRLLLLAGILSFLGWLSASVGTWNGCYWLDFGERPENFLLPGLVLTAIGAARQGRYHDFPGIYRGIGVLAVLVPILVLANWGGGSYFRVDAAAIEIVYQLLGFLLSGIAAWVGIRLGWTGVGNTGATFFVLFLYTKFFDWWWEWMPKWIFFLILGGVALGLLVLLQRFRGLASREAA